ncbi:MAG: SDR family NAD(P)-dependent oxidoreductase [Myxococcales bacterium]|nr:SDR family NAD(P)-dependent oxidoreductase [Myxococcales bacterium]
MAFDEQALAEALRLLEDARELEPDDARYLALERAAAFLTKSAKKKRRLRRKQRSRAADQALLAAVANEAEGAEGDERGALHNQRLCYVCKAPYREPHARYRTMCRACGDRSQTKRDEPLELAGRRALVTGGRVKIGFASALRLLRAGAEVVITTRFAGDASDRFEAEPDHARWRERLDIVALDFRDVRGLVAQVARWAAGAPLDIIINNAAQTVRQPPEVYRALHEREGRAVAELDLRRDNSWVQRLGEIRAVEMVEAQVVNNVAPFVIVNGLLESMARSPRGDRYVVNVSAVEGQFARAHEDTRHPHTNMAKAALNMLTRTSAGQLRDRGIYMVSVDPGWMSHEGSSAPSALPPPLDADDAAARVLDPIARGVRGEPLWGVLLKDYQVVPW